ncbi:unnamed protein product [Effrenium voratum]|nr:unnamed protein product [Effrenium voratum]
MPEWRAALVPDAGRIWRLETDLGIVLALPFEERAGYGGVPFVVATSSKPSAPAVIEEWQLPDFAIIHRPRGVRNGHQPLMTVKLTVYQDHSAVLAFSRSHMLFDGSSAWTFLGLWASLAKGDTIREPWWHKDQVEKQVPGDKELPELAKRVFNMTLEPSMLNSLVKKVLIPTIGPLVDTMFLHARYSLYRPVLFFSDAELAALKEAATPRKLEPGQDDWVTTQEAFCAYVLLTLGCRILPKTSWGNVQMMFLLDARKALRLPPNQLLGNGLTFCNISIPTQQMLQMDLPELAAILHEALASKQGSLESQRDLWQLTTKACEKGLENQVMGKIHRGPDTDMKFAVNNSSKRALPDFGTGRCEAVVTNAGPTIFLPAHEGMNMYLDNSVFSSCSSKVSPELKQEALEALRTQLPKKA